MKIIALIRTLNESSRIDACCEAWQFCDEILIADGGSTDDTVEKALKWPKVQVRKFTEMVELEKGYHRNPDGPHLNFLYDWGRSEGADWLISQDCDQRPNKYLKEQARSIMEKAQKNFIMPVQIFLWEKLWYFPKMSRAGQGWMHGIWAHRASINLHVIDKMPHYEFTLDGIHSVFPDKIKQNEEIDPPCCYLHFGWENKAKADALRKYYDESGLIPHMAHPLAIGGQLEPILEWMVEN